MGSARWSSADWTRYADSTAHRSTEKVFTARSIDPDLDPFGVEWRESRDSALNPNSTALIVGLDVTGSMGMIADALARRGLGILVEEILARQPVPDPHIMLMGIGDILHDQAPLQVTQFEADIRIARQLERLWLEKGGGGNNWESYNLPWYFAALHTSIDCFEKRGRKGYLFTVGDEEPPPGIPARGLARVFGDRVARDLNSRELLALASRQYHVFHVIIEEGNYARHDPAGVRARWADLLGQRVISLADHRRLAEVIVSTIAINEGADREEVVASWARATGAVVRRAVATVPRSARRL
ncbi:MAG: hypothetical protein EKK69_14640 [Candidatus Competibacteraceae bacterium]|nr:MAG: hypothetical protein EKK69_14640 [Candidatus Competibacteraceae bacterium]